MDALREYRERQQQKYLERKRQESSPSAPVSHVTTVPHSGTTVPRPSVVPTTVPTTAPTHTIPPPSNVTQPPLRPTAIAPTVSQDSEFARRLQEEEDERYARELAAAMEQPPSGDVRPPDTQFTERLLDVTPPAVPQTLFAQEAPVVRPTAYGTARVTHQFQPTHFVPQQRPPITIPRPVYSAAYGQPIRSAYTADPGNAPTVRGDSTPQTFFPPVTASPLARNSPYPSSTPTPISSDDDERARQLREDEELARRLQEEYS
eukprot:Blabericola_migrator_1__2481@NODE_169_length_12121_cov_125_483906_g147_i0_p8_GENE_NODE_169_length_12121_cov_125_483906_g147_i0NODE_169_length_12121_cov_125_483906_g147_i0_p8_ORF_typecomplete_len261_score54_25CCDC50_N/PF15295_6/6_1e03CCDC50_N/PF15295_6/0_47CCDC50_N/PF15295_6/0_25_NODE_169_length_12121_cov_125_483906_g147_i01052611308